jgi:excisionase family DNA binding protein
METEDRPTISPWPDAARMVGCGKSKIYEMIAAGEIEVIRIGRYIRVLTRPLRRKLGAE